jgi:hypothetical protein
MGPLQFWGLHDQDLIQKRAVFIRVFYENKNHAKLGEFESLCVVVILSSVIDLVCLGVV